MRHKTLLLFLFISVFSQGQNGFAVIHKAQKKMEKQKYKKALRLLDVAEDMDYGFCGNAWIEAESIIAETRVQIYAETDQLEMAANTLNELRWDLYIKDIDSLKTVYYVSVFGKELVKQEIDSCIALITAETLDSINYLDMSINLPVGFSKEPFRLHLTNLEDSILLVRIGSNETEAFERFKIALSEEAFYQLLL